MNWWDYKIERKQALALDACFYHQGFSLDRPHRLLVSM